MPAIPLRSRRSCPDPAAVKYPARRERTDGLSERPVRRQTACQAVVWGSHPFHNYKGAHMWIYLRSVCASDTVCPNRKYDSTFSGKSNPFLKIPSFLELCPIIHANTRRFSQKGQISPASGGMWALMPLNRLKSKKDAPWFGWCCCTYQHSQ